ncbi:lipocalin-like domain-containing protein [Acidisphaera sp. S103]|uniref:lipocalin-like domain-containing protein n=1 Tax=Acidisphaera sp. S103 TaxID=1747223 RepID=UPI00131B7493
MKSAALFDNTISGTWSLVSFTEKEHETGTVCYPLGRCPHAMVIYTVDGYVSTIFVSDGRQAPTSEQPSESEKAGLYSTMVAFSGRYRLEGHTLTYYPDISWNETWTGKSQMRLFELDGDDLSVRSTPFLSPLSGKRTTISMRWKRMKPAREPPSLDQMFA